MVVELLERRALEQVIRRAEAEEHLLERRLDNMAFEQWRARRDIETLSRRLAFHAGGGDLRP